MSGRRVSLFGLLFRLFLYCDVVGVYRGDVFRFVGSLVLICCCVVLVLRCVGEMCFVLFVFFWFVVVICVCSVLLLMCVGEMCFVCF